MALSQYIKKWSRDKDKMEFADFMQKFMDDKANSRCFITTAVVTEYSLDIAVKGFFTYRYE